MLHSSPCQLESSLFPFWSHQFCPMSSNLPRYLLASPRCGLAFPSLRSARPPSLYATSFQLKPRRNDAFTTVTRTLTHCRVRRSDKKADDSRGSTSTPLVRENIYTIPNLLTVSRILACPVLGWSILHDDFFLATGLLVYAGLSDLVGNNTNG